MIRYYSFPGDTTATHPVCGTSGELCQLAVIQCRKVVRTQLDVCVGANLLLGQIYGDIAACVFVTSLGAGRQRCSAGLLTISDLSAHVSQDTGIDRDDSLRPLVDIVFDELDFVPAVRLTHKFINLHSAVCSVIEMVQYGAVLR